MIISPGRQFIFVHIPKTGGTALALALEARAHRDDILIGDTPKAQKRKRRLAGLTPAGRLWKHSTLQDIDGIVSGDEMARMMVFTLVRNPWDRLVSYYQWLQVQQFQHPAVGLPKTLPFSAFLHHPQTTASIAARPYRSYVTDRAGVMQADHFIRLEHWATDLAPVWDHLGFRFELARANASKRARDWRPYYRPEDAAHVATLCADDIARWGYGFEDGA